MGSSSATPVPGTSASAGGGGATPYSVAHSYGSSVGLGCSPDMLGTSPGGGLAMFAPSSSLTPTPPRLSIAVGPGLRSLTLAGCSQVNVVGVKWVRGQVCVLALSPYPYP